MFSPEKQAFFDAIEAQQLALTYDDVRIRTGKSETSVPEISVASRFSTNIELKVPIVSAAMDTVTTSEMAIAMAKLGGIGIIHAGLDAKEQKDEVRRVKLSLNGLIEDPITFNNDRSIESILNECADRRLDFRTFPVLDAEKHLVGLLTQKDFDFCDDLSVTAEAAMTPLSEILLASPNTAPHRAYRLMKESKKKTLPLIDQRTGTLSGLYVWSDVQRIVNGNDGNYNLDSDKRLRVGAAIPTDKEALERIAGMRHYLDVAVIDTAQGDSKYAFETLKAVKAAFPDLDVVVGNISEGASAQALVKAGADGIKVGQGPGSICTTRVETGIGTPQVTAVYECARAIYELGKTVPVCADGGIKDPGDVPIAIAAGAHSVMLGSMLAGTAETPGEIIRLENGTQVKSYRGMGSIGAMRDSAAAQKRYGQDPSKPLFAEGIEAYVPYRGGAEAIIGHLVTALKRGMNYAGAPDIEQHRRETRLRRITNAGLRESHPHDVKPFRRADYSVSEE